MRAGNLDREITIQRSATTLNDAGTPQVTWIALVTLRAQVVQSSTEEFIRAHGASSEAIVIFRTRYHDGLLLADRVSYQGQLFDLKEIKEIGRRRGLELRAERRGP